MTALDLDAIKATIATITADTNKRVPATDFEDRSNVRGLIEDATALVAEVERKAAIIAKAREVAEHWKDGYMSNIDRGKSTMPWAVGTHPLSLVLSALDGETDPAHLGMPVERTSVLPEGERK